MPETPTPDAGVRRRVAVTLGIIVALALQPAFINRDPYRQTAFAWEMYSKSGPLDEFEVVTQGGAERFEVHQIQDRALATVDYTELLPEHICRVESDVIEVRVYRGGDLLRVHRCRR